MTKIYLSPSSQWANTYSYAGYNEALVCGLIAEAAYKALTRCGFDVKLGSNNGTMQSRTAESNAWKADYHVPIHTNAGGGEGTVFFCYSGSKDDKCLNSVYNAIAALSPGKDQGIKVNDGLYEVNSATATTIYIETEFHDNENLAKWVVENVENIGEAIAKGFCNGVGVKYTGKPDITGKLYRVQVGAFSKRENAEKMRDSLKAKGYDCFVVGG